MIQNLTAVFALFVVALAILSPDGAKSVSYSYSRVEHPAQSVSNEDCAALDRLIAKAASVAYEPTGKRIKSAG